MGQHCSKCGNPFLTLSGGPYKICPKCGGRLTVIPGTRKQWFILTLVIIIVITTILIANILFENKTSETKLESRTHIPTSRLRYEYKNLTTYEVESMLNKHGFYDSRWHKSKTFKNKFERKYINSDLVVNDHATGLMWQHVASSDRKTFDDARNWIENLNQKGYAGYHDWRLPTLEEGASLIESSKKNFYLYIDPLFIGIQENMWTGDQYGPFDAWVVYFDEGNIVSIPLFDDAYVRVVRSEN